MLVPESNRFPSGGRPWHVNTSTDGIFHSQLNFGNIKLGLHRIATNLGPIYELKISGFLGLVGSRETLIVRSHASVYTDVS